MYIDSTTWKCRSPILELMKSYLNDRIQRVFVNDTISDSCKVLTVGVLQVSILAALLFLYTSTIFMMQMILTWYLFVNSQRPRFVTLREYHVGPRISVIVLQITKLTCPSPLLQAQIGFGGIALFHWLALCASSRNLNLFTCRSFFNLYW